MDCCSKQPPRAYPCIGSIAAPGDQRETVMFEGDPLSPTNHALIEKTQAERFRSGALWGTGPEIGSEEIVRAMMVVRANAMVHNAPSRSCRKCCSTSSTSGLLRGAVPRHVG